MRWGPSVLLLTLFECGHNEGPFEAFLILEDQSGAIREFSLGGNPSYQACADMGAGEAREYSGHKEFWANPEFNYGGSRGAEDWKPYRVIGFSCTFDRNY